MRRLLTVLLLACVAAVVVPPYAAQAHNVLVGSDPRDGATLTAAPGRVTLVFDQAVRQGYAQIGVTGADGSSWADGDAVVAAERVSVKLKALPGGGAYVVGYRILSADGHPVTGKLTFTVASAGPASPAPAEATPDAAATPNAAGAPDGMATPDTATTPDATAPDAAAAPDAVATSEAVAASDAAGASGAAAEAAANGGAGMAVVWIVGALVLLAAGTVVALRRTPPPAPATPGTPPSAPAAPAAPDPAAPAASAPTGPAAPSTTDSGEGVRS
ncbi:copper resistance CopC family protein [Nonomuraea bangladeshensis]|uniref:copper resistance CopC family protein n=1 Tax=Nonomuraea bangladeshensis TaxID=404385 RepID=UPI003C2C689E